MGIIRKSTLCITCKGNCIFLSEYKHDSPDIVGYYEGVMFAYDDYTFDLEVCLNALTRKEVFNALANMENFKFRTDE